MGQAKSMLKGFIDFREHLGIVQKAWFDDQVSGHHVAAGRYGPDMKRVHGSYAIEAEQKRFDSNA